MTVEDNKSSGLNEDQTTKATISTISVNLPTLWTNEPAFWYSIIESQLELAGITAEKTKYLKVVVALPPSIAAQVSHITSQPFAEGHYE